MVHIRKEILLKELTAELSFEGCSVIGQRMVSRTRKWGVRKCTGGAMGLEEL